MLQRSQGPGMRTVECIGICRRMCITRGAIARLCDEKRRCELRLQLLCVSEPVTVGVLSQFVSLSPSPHQKLQSFNLIR